MVLDPVIGTFRSLWGLWVMIFFCGAVLWVSKPNCSQGVPGISPPPKNEDNEER
jgi:hypothetical protein